MSLLKEEERKRDIRKDRVKSLAMGEAIKYSVGATAAIGAATVLAALKNKNFSRFASISAKMSFPVMAGLGTFAYKYEMVQYNALTYPERWGLEEYVEKGKITNIPIHHRTMNFLYDNPFYFISGVSFPLLGYIFKEQLKLKHLTISQKIMHTRVLAQGGVLVILLLTMSFTGYMDKHGRFPEPGQERLVNAADKEEVVDFGVGNTTSRDRKRGL